MRYAIEIWLIGIGTAIVVVAAPWPVQAQAAQPGLRIVGPAITKQSTQRTVATVRSGMKEGSASAAVGEGKNATKAGGNGRREKDVKPKIVRGK